MDMEIVIARPPLFDEIDRKFHVRGLPVLFCWGNLIYNPESVEIPPEIVLHEAVHARQQGNAPEFWWRRYIDEPAFRLDQEIPAHQVEYRWLLDNAPRAERRRAKKQIAQRLSGPLYGRMISRREAETLLAEA